MRVKIILWLALLIPVGWILGLHVNDPARVILVIAMIFALIPAFRKYLINPVNFSKLQSRLMIAFIIVYPLIICAQHFVRVLAGSQGINFAYRTQVIANVTQKGGLYSSILREDYSIINWLTHHFNPVLFIPGLMGFIGIPAFSSQIFSLALIIISTCFILYRILKHLNYKNGALYLPIVFFLSIYSIRHPLTYGIEDEFFALPAIALAFLFLFKQKFLLSCVNIAATFFVKESFFLLGISWALMAFILYKKGLLGIKSKNLYYSYVLAGSGLMLFVLYTFGHELIFGQPYEHFHKSSGLSSFFNIEMVSDKFYNLFLLFLPFLFLPFYDRKCFLLMIPALPIIVIMFYSDYMYKATDYYAVVPSFVILISCIYCVPEKIRQMTSSAVPLISIIILSIAFIYGTWKPLKIIFEADPSGFVSYSDMEEVSTKYLKNDSKALVSLSLAPLSTMIDKLSVIENESKISNRDFDLVIIRSSDTSDLKSDLQNFTIAVDTLGQNSNIYVYKSRY
ncbi:MAG: DUF2079 domain-containing protein [Ignavibacteriaceae bacterium]|nr:DUF2079 domain-containing protein [Ignavibacteriaceae bacterium]